MNILTKRLHLQTFQNKNISDTYLSWLNDPVVTRYSNQRFCRHTYESSETYLKSFVGTSNSFLLIKRISNQMPIGTATIYRNTIHGTADIGLMLGEKSCWGKGYGGEAWKAILDNVLQEEGIRKVTGGTTRTNLSMVQIMERSGMMLEAVRPRQELIEGEPVDLLYYARFAEPVT